MDFHPEHLLSFKSKKQGRNCFLFRLAPGSCGMVFGINLNKHPHLTNAIFHRWIDLLTVFPGELPDPFEIMPIKVTRTPSLVLNYHAAIAGDILPHDATNVLPGDYTTSSLDDIPTLSVGDTSKLFTYQEDQPVTRRFVGVYSSRGLDNVSTATPGPIDYEGMTFWNHLATKPARFQEIVLKRNHVCFITGAEDPSVLEATWIFPPNFAFSLHPMNEWLTLDPTPYIDHENGILLRKELIPVFEKNSLGIDVDDGYRVIIFDDQELGALDFIIPTHATPPSNFRSTKSEGYLRNHFKCCLQVHYCGGDIHDQYPRNKILYLMNELGIGHDCEDVPIAPLEDERWDSELGRVLFQAFIENEVAVKRWEPCDRDGNPISVSPDAASESDSTSW